MVSNSIHVAGTRVPTSWLGVCRECECDLDRGQPHDAGCSIGREIEEERIAAEIAHTNQARESEIDHCPDCGKPTHATEGNQDGICVECLNARQCDVCGRYGHRGVDCTTDTHAGVRSFQDPATYLFAEVVHAEIVYRVYLLDDSGNRVSREAEASTEALAYSAASTCAEFSPGEKFIVTKEIVETLCIVSAR